MWGAITKSSKIPSKVIFPAKCTDILSFFLHYCKTSFFSHLAFYTLCWVNVAKTPIKLRDDSHFRVCSLFSLQAFYPYIPEVPLYTSLSVFFAFFLVIFTPHQTHLLVVVSSETRSSFSSIDVVSLSVYVRLTLSLFFSNAISDLKLESHLYFFFKTSVNVCSWFAYT